MAFLGTSQDTEGHVGVVMGSGRDTLSSFFVSLLTQAHAATEDFKTN